MADHLPVPLKVGRGQLFSFTEIGFEVTTKRPFKAKESLSVEWSNVRKLSMDLLCCGALLGVALSDGQRLHFRCRRGAAVVLYRILHRLSAKTGADTQVAPEVQKRMELHPTVQAVEGGLMVRKAGRCCRKTVLFLPWDRLATCSMSRDRRCVAVNSMWAPEAGTHEVEVAPSAPATSTVPIVCAKDDCESLFMELVAMMCRARGCEEPLPRPQLEGEGARPLQSHGPGAYLLPDVGRRGGTSVAFIPWDAMISVQFEAGKLKISDRMGATTRVKRASRADMVTAVGSLESASANGQLAFCCGGLQASERFDLARKCWQDALSREGAPELPDGCTFAGGVLRLAEGKDKELRWAVPLERACCLELTYRMGKGRVSVATEKSRERLILVRKLKQKQMLDLSDSLRVLQFGEGAAAADVTTFGAKPSGKVDARTMSGVAESCLRLALGKGVVREWDLARVVSCRPDPRHHRGRDLLVRVVSTSQGDQTEHRVPVLELSAEKVAALAEDIAQRSEKRLQALQTERDEAAKKAAEEQEEAEKAAAAKEDEELACKESARQAVEEATQDLEIAPEDKASIFNAAYEAAQKVFKDRHDREKEALNTALAAELEAREQALEKEREATAEALAAVEAERAAREDACKKAEDERAEREAAQAAKEEAAARTAEELAAKQAAEEKAAEAERVNQELAERVGEASAKAAEEAEAKFRAEARADAVSTELQVVKENSSAEVGRERRALADAQAEAAKLQAELREAQQRNALLEKRLDAMSPKVVENLI